MYSVTVLLVIYLIGLTLPVASNININKCYIIKFLYMLQRPAFAKAEIIEM